MNARKDRFGKYWLKVKGNNICSQCNKPIKDGDKIFVDADGQYHEKLGSIEISNVCIYHYNCIISDDSSEDDEPLKPEDYM